MFLRSSAAVVFLATLMLPVLGQEAALSAQPGRPWQVTCVSAPTGPDLVCTISQTLIAGETRQRVLSATIAGSDVGPVMTLALPHGLQLQQGVRLTVDDSAAGEFPIITADQNGSYAEVPLTDALLGSLRAGQTLEVTVQAFQGGEVVLQLSLAGFGDAASRL